MSRQMNKVLLFINSVEQWLSTAAAWQMWIATGEMVRENTVSNFDGKLRQKLVHWADRQKCAQ